MSDPTLKPTELLRHGVNIETVITTSYVELTDKLGAITDVFKLVEGAHLMDRITIHHLVRQKKSSCTIRQVGGRVVSSSPAT